MKRTIITNLLFCMVSLSCFAQVKFSPSAEETSYAGELKSRYEDDHVAILYKNDVIKFGFDDTKNLVTVTNEMDDQMINLDDRSVISKYEMYDEESEISEFRVNFKNNKNAAFEKRQIQDEAYTSEGLFHNDSRVKYVNVDFPLKGYQYFTKIIKNYKDVKYFTSIYFQEEYPIINRKIIIEVPDWLNIEFKEMNFEGYQIKKEVSQQSNKTIYTYNVADLPAQNYEEKAPGPSYIYPHLLVLPKSFKKDNQEKILFANTADLYKWYSSLTGQLTNDNSLFKQKVADLIKDSKTDMEKVRSIFYWVQDNIRYIAFENGIAGFKPEEASNVYRKLYGDCKGMANLTKQMLVEAGFDARLTWLGTKHIAYDYSLPNMSVDNHMICTLVIDGKYIFLDSTEKYISLEEYANRIQGKEVLIENGSDYIIKKVPVSDFLTNKESTTYRLKVEGDKLTGTATRLFTGESRTSLLQYLHSLENRHKDKFLKFYLSNDGNANFIASGIETSDLLDREADIKMDYNLAINNSVSSFGDEMYIDLELDKSFSHLDFSKRKNSYEFYYKQAVENTTVLQIPEGYRVSNLPESLQISTPDYDVEVTFTQQDNVLTYTKKFNFKSGSIQKSEFKDWNAFLKKLKQTYQEQIILTKK